MVNTTVHPYPPRMPRNGWGFRAARSAALAVAAAVLCAGSAVAAPCPFEDSAAAAATPDELAGALVCMVNRERRKHGLRSLEVSVRLAAAAAGHAADMHENTYFSHDSPDGRSFVDRIRDAGYMDGREDQRWTVGETLAWGNEAVSQPASLFRALLDSPPHRRVILDGPHRELGVGVVHGTPEGDPDGATVAIEFGSLVSPAALREAPTRELREDGADKPKVKGKKQRGKGKPKGPSAKASSGGWKLRISAAWAWQRPAS